jgi:UDPglucose 6-dehydrogenase
VVTGSIISGGAGDEIEAMVRWTSLDADVAVVSNPEFLRKGAAISELNRPDRTVVGA